jgi:flagellar biosynthesis protein
MTQAPVKSAVALAYQWGTPAPKILAQGNAEVAWAILQRAQELGIPTKTDPGLVAFLLQLKINDWVPPELFAAVAQVLAWAYEMDGRLDEKPSGEITPEGL